MTYTRRDEQRFHLVRERVGEATGPKVEAHGDQDGVHEKQTQVKEEEGEADMIDPAGSVGHCILVLDESKLEEVLGLIRECKTLATPPVALTMSARNPAAERSDEQTIVMVNQVH